MIFPQVAIMILMDTGCHQRIVTLLHIGQLIGRLILIWSTNTIQVHF